MITYVRLRLTRFSSNLSRITRLRCATETRQSRSELAWRTSPRRFLRWLAALSSGLMLRSVCRNLRVKRWSEAEELHVVSRPLRCVVRHGTGEWLMEYPLWNFLQMY